MRRRWLIPALIASLGLAGCGGRQLVGPRVQGADPSSGPKLIEAFGCGSCHTIAGVQGANGEIGPRLVHFADRRYIAGVLPNTAANLVRWIVDPQAVAPGTVMPDLGVGDPQARDIAAYLYRH